MPLIDNIEIKEWYEAENLRRTARDAQTGLTIIAMLVQMALYYSLWSDAVDKRDEGIDKQKLLLDYLYEKDMEVDYPMMKKKQEALNIPLPKPDLCGDAILWDECTMKDGEAIDLLGSDQSKLVCGGMPSNWFFGEGALSSSKASAYNGAILANAGKRREEHFRQQKTQLVLRSQATARFSAGPILKDYGQAVAIQEGMAQIFAAGLNSAGVGLGSAIGQMVSSSASVAGSGSVAGGS